MNTADHLSRRSFVKVSGATVVGACLGPNVQAAEDVRLKSWELVEIPSLPKKLNPMLKLTATNGAVGYSKPVAKDLVVAAEAVKGANLLDHDGLYDVMMAKHVPKSQIAAMDIACWDLHARMVQKPLHALLGTKRMKMLRYGDVRGQQPDFSPQKYADNTARYLEREKLQATKLHFPGNMGTPESISLPMIFETLQAVRKAVGKDKILAWDAYPGSAESATTSVDEAKQILKLMDELDYSWIEGPLLPAECLNDGQRLWRRTHLDKVRPTPTSTPVSPIASGCLNMQRRIRRWSSTCTGTGRRTRIWPWRTTKRSCRWASSSGAAKFQKVT